MDELQALIADYRHNQLGVTYGRKKNSVMAVDMMLADRILAMLREKGYLREEK